MSKIVTRVSRFLLAVLLFSGTGLIRADDTAPAVPAAPAGGEAAPAAAPAQDSGTPAGAPAPQQPGGGNFFVLMIIMGVVMWFMVIRPQRKEEKARKEMLSQLKKNDHVVTSGGLYGVVAGVTDEDVVLKVDESKDVRIKVTRASVAKVLTDDGAAKDAK